MFGATGTGKSFLTRILLAGLIHHNAASVLVFDMHNEYGFDDTASDTGLQGDRVKNEVQQPGACGWVGKRDQIRGQAPDFNLEIDQRDIQPGDIELLTRELNLKETTPTTLEALVSSFGRARSV